MITRDYFKNSAEKKGNAQYVPCDSESKKIDQERRLKNSKRKAREHPEQSEKKKILVELIYN